MSQKTTEANTTKTESNPMTPEQDSARRDFIKVSVAAGLGACALGAPICAAVQLVTAPVFAEGGSGKFYPIATLDSLTERPQRFAIIDDKKDAWTTLPDQKIGTFYLRKVGDEVLALHADCPHMGCMLQVINKNPRTGADEELYSCPCHTAYFTLDGARIGDNASPRNMDSLETKIEDGRVLVKFEKFTFGIAEKKAN